MKFYEWDYDNGIVTQYERLGECRQCGECCRATINLGCIKPPYNTDGKGVWCDTLSGRYRYLFKVTGVELGTGDCCRLVNGLCLDHGKKLAICRLWPMGPCCIESFPGCGYSFREIGHWPFEVPNA